MRLRRSRAAADEALLRLVNDGYHLLQVRQHAFEAKMRQPGVDESAEVALADQEFRAWAERVSNELQDIFPTEREAYLFVRSDTPGSNTDTGAIYGYFWGKIRRIEEFVRMLDEIRLRELGRYTDLPLTARLYVEDIDSFSKVRDINPSMVAHSLSNGRLELSEEHVQVALEQILEVAFHRRDWGGETNDLYTANVVVNGRRTATAFALKGKGCKASELTIADCGKNGDQLLRLLDSPAKLFIVQYVGPVSDAVVKDIEGKVEHRRTLGRPGWFCVIDGQDTARLLKAYGKLHP
jgi:hypothetical protein